MDIKLEAWKFPSGNKCAVMFERDSAGVGHINFEWDSPPPLTAEDNKFYRAVVLPSATRLIASFHLKKRAK